MNKPWANRLAREKSPYLLQHAHNPVDWYPWSKEAFKKAEAENKPIFLSIGYSTCHWCHVMEKESFEDDEVARALNKVFVPIKVDREERPDIDSYYMTVCQLITGTGGWPLTIIMSPTKEPFFAATYLPKTSRFGRIGLLELIRQIDILWHTRQDHITQSANGVAKLVRQAIQTNEKGELTEESLHAAYRGLVALYDETAGGFGNAPKFPTPHKLSFLLRYWVRTKQETALKIAEHTLTAMRMGGVYDHIGYGFHRYSTDKNWILPHFEKMLYDQALLTIAYTEAFQITHNDLYRNTAHEIIEYVLRDMTSQNGAFYSAEDADSEGVEGRFYTWEESEIREILDPSESETVVRVFNIKSSGNYVGETTRRMTGKNLLYMCKSMDALAADLNMSQGELAKRLARARAIILKHREKRVRPHKDRKILTDWNGLMIAALAKAGRIFDSDLHKRMAKRAADFFLSAMRDSDGMLYHRFIGSERAIPGFLDDYVFLTWGMIELYESTFEPRYLRAAYDLHEKTVNIFWDNEDRAFFFASQNNDLPLRKKEIHDGAIPSGNSIAMYNMLRLAGLTGQHKFAEQARHIATYFARQIKENPLNHIQTMTALNLAFSASIEVAISGNPDDPLTLEMLRTINRSPELDLPIVLRPNEGSSEVVDIAPFTRNLLPLDGKTTAYLCQTGKCEMPINEPEELSNKLEIISRGSRS
jgi:uncharacterized protein YyaL (SSP411 family)